LYSRFFFNTDARRCAGIFYGSNKIPHKAGSFWEWLQLLFSTPHEVLDIALTLILGELGRWCLGGGKFRERLGDLIVCLMLFYLVRPWFQQSRQFSASRFCLVLWQSPSRCWVGTASARSLLSTLKNEQALA